MAHGYSDITTRVLQGFTTTVTIIKLSGDIQSGTVDVYTKQSTKYILKN